MYLVVDGRRIKSLDMGMAGSRVLIVHYSFIVIHLLLILLTFVVNIIYKCTFLMIIVRLRFDSCVLLVLLLQASKCIPYRQKINSLNSTTSCTHIVFSVCLPQMTNYSHCIYTKREHLYG